MLSLTASAAGGLAGQLQQRAEREGFSLSGLDRLPDWPALRPSGGNPEPPVDALLRGIDHVLVKGADGRIVRLLILGVGSVPPPPSQPWRQVLETRRRGRHHLVTAILVGNDGQQVEVELLVDTGASFVVLPRSLMPRLGFRAEALEWGELQTANGGIRAGIARLPVLRLGGLRVEGVTVAFVDGAALGDNSLLGMSALSRFQVTLDDAGNRLILVARDRE